MLVLTTNKGQKKKKKLNFYRPVKTFFKIVSKRGFLTLVIFTRPVSGTKHQLQKPCANSCKAFPPLFFFIQNFKNLPRRVSQVTLRFGLISETEINRHL